MHKISLLDTVYTSASTWSLNVQETDEGYTLELWTGEFWIDIRDTHKKYNISHEFFWAIPVWIGKIYIDTRDTKKYQILSVGGIVSMSLRRQGDTTWLTDIYLYPHMSLTFTPSRNRFLNQADLVRISSVYNLEYYSFPLFNWKTDISNTSPFFQQIVQKTQTDNTQHQKTIRSMKGVEVWKFPGAQYIEQYYSLFINQEKQKVYYKNKALDKILYLLALSSHDSNAVTDAFQAIEYLEQYPQEHREIMNIFHQMLQTFTYSYNDDALFVKMNLYELYNKLRNQTAFVHVDYTSAHVLSILYSRLDFSWVYGYKDFQNFFEVHLKSLGIDINDSVSLEWEDSTYLEYFSFFVEQVIVSRFEGGAKVVDTELLKDGNLGNILQVMKWYIELNSIIYSWRGSQKAITLVYKYISVLESLEKFVEFSFFEVQRNQEGLLQKKKSTNITSGVLNLLSQNIAGIFDFYEVSKKFLDEQKQRDISIMNQYDSLSLILPEYIEALENYELYVYNYSEDRKSLLEIQTYGNTGEEILSRESFLGYMSKFKFVSLENLKLEIIEDSYYKASDVFIQGNNFSFNISPFSDHKLDNIYIDGRPINSSYKLDVIQYEWDEKKKWLLSDKKDIYEFSLFFLNTFFSTNQKDSEIFEVQTQTAQEDTVIVVFKRDKLLWEKGEFSQVRNNLRIDYDDITVTDSGGKYGISIDDAEASMKSVNEFGTSISIQAVFRSDYLLTDEKHQFRNIGLQPYVQRGAQRTFGLDDSWIEFVGSVDLPELQETLDTFALSYSGISYLYSTISREFTPTDISIKYSVFQKKTTFRFDYNNENITISIAWNTLNSISVWTTELLQTPELYRNFGNFIFVIKEQ